MVVGSQKLPAPSNNRTRGRKNGKKINSRELLKKIKKKLTR
jgi:hypothetical protein